MAKADLTAQRLRELLNYDPETGVFTWRIKPANRVNIGDVAGCADKYGYLIFSIGNRLFKAHRLAWLYMTGEWPDEIDHINHDPADNRIANLRNVSSSVNKQNKIRSQRNNVSCGLLGVTWDKDRSRWMAKIKTGGKNKFLGRFLRVEEAHEAYIAAKRQFHEGCTI